MSPDSRKFSRNSTNISSLAKIFCTNIIGRRYRVSLARQWLTFRQSSHSLPMLILANCPSQCLHLLHSPLVRTRQIFNGDTVSPQKGNLSGLLSPATNSSLLRKMKIFFTKLERHILTNPQTKNSCIGSMLLRLLSILSRSKSLRR